MPASPRAVQALRRGDSQQASEALQMCIKAGSSQDADVVLAVSERIRGNEYIDEDVLISWLTAAAPESTSAFALAWPRLQKNPWAVLALYKGQEFGRQVEEALLDLLGCIPLEAGQPLRPELLRALATHGTRLALPWLETVREEYAQLAQRKLDVHAAIPSVLTELEATTFSESLALCQEAIAKVSARADTPGASEARPCMPLSRAAAEHIRRAEDVLAGAYPGMALNTLRMHLEAVCDHLIAHWGVTLPLKNGPSRLSDKLSVLQRLVEAEDKWLFAQMCGINKLTDFGSHHSSDFLNRITHTEVEPVFRISSGLHTRFLDLSGSPSLVRG